MVVPRLHHKEVHSTAKIGRKSFSLRSQPALISILMTPTQTVTSLKSIPREAIQREMMVFHRHSLAVVVGLRQRMLTSSLTQVETGSDEGTKASPLVMVQGALEKERRRLRIQMEVRRRLNGGKQNRTYCSTRIHFIGHVGIYILGNFFLLYF